MKVKIKLAFRASPTATPMTVDATLIAPRHLGLAAHRSVCDSYWVVSDRVTGMMVGCGMTQESARRDALDRLTAHAGFLPISELLNDLRSKRLAEMRVAA